MQDDIAEILKLMSRIEYDLNTLNLECVRGNIPEVQYTNFIMSLNSVLPKQFRIRKITKREKV